MANAPAWLKLLAMAVLVAGCGGEEGKRRPLTRSPSQDYRPDEPRTADGRPLGADGVNPADRVKAGATTGGLAPGWKVVDGKLTYDPEWREADHEHSEGEAQDAGANATGGAGATTGDKKAPPSQKKSEPRKSQ
jgi:hypothetical protein